MPRTARVIRVGVMSRALLQSIQVAVDAQQAAALQQLAEASHGGARQDQPVPADAQPSGPYL